MDARRQAQLREPQGPHAALHVAPRRHARLWPADPRRRADPASVGRGGELATEQHWWIPDETKSEPRMNTGCADEMTSMCGSKLQDIREPFLRRLPVDRLVHRLAEFFVQASPALLVVDRDARGEVEHVLGHLDRHDEAA